MATDIEIARAKTLLPIGEIARKIGLGEDDLVPYGRTMAKVRVEAVADREISGKLILVSAVTPTPAGEGKTTVTVGLGQALGKLGLNGEIDTSGMDPDVVEELRRLGYVR